MRRTAPSKAGVPGTGGQSSIAIEFTMLTTPFYSRRFSPEVQSMTRVEELERRVHKLSRAELSAFRDWFRRYDSDAWDRQIEEDIRAGKLEGIAREAIDEYRAGKAREI
jgi:hypothetical protein